MNAYATYALKRLLQFVLVVFIGINLAYLITHATPIDPVEQTVAAATAFGNGLSNAGLDADRPCASLDRRAPIGCDDFGLRARQSARRTCGLLSRQPRAENRRPRRDGGAPDPLLHRRL